MQETQVLSLGWEHPWSRKWPPVPVLENAMDRGAWWATVHRITKSWTWLIMHTPYFRNQTVCQPVCINEVTLVILTKSSDIPVLSHLCSSSTWFWLSPRMGFTCIWEQICLPPSAQASLPCARNLLGWWAICDCAAASVTTVLSGRLCCGLCCVCVGGWGVGSEGTVAAFSRFSPLIN